MTLCIPITASTQISALDDITEANRLADWIELRLDYLTNPTLEQIALLVKSCQKPVIATCRASGQKRDILQTALDAGADLIDLEYEEDWTGFPSEKTLLSIHLDHTPSFEKLLSLYHAMREKRPALIKIVTQAVRYQDNIVMLELLKQVPDGHVIAFCMGEKSLPSRCLCCAYGSFLTFGTLSIKKQSAPGQPTAEQIKSIIVTKKTQVCAVIGDPIAHSRSPQIHQKAYAKENLDYLFLPLRVKSDDLIEVLELFRHPPFKGLAVTLPHKQAVIPFLDALDPDAKEVGAVNTIVNTNGTLKGYNTDLYGAIEPLRRRLVLKGKKVLILGSGGAAQAFIHGLKKEGAEVVVLCRRPDLEKGYRSLDLLPEVIQDADLLIQTTPVGMVPNTEESLVPSHLLRKGLVVFDCVYTPEKTRLIRDAESVGCETISGLEMFILQAQRQFFLFTGRPVRLNLVYTGNR